MVLLNIFSLLVCEFCLSKKFVGYVGVCMVVMLKMKDVAGLQNGFGLVSFIKNSKNYGVFVLFELCMKYDIESFRSVGINFRLDTENKYNTKRNILFFFFNPKSMARNVIHMILCITIRFYKKKTALFLDLL